MDVFMGLDLGLRATGLALVGAEVVQAQREELRVFRVLQTKTLKFSSERTRTFLGVVRIGEELLAESVSPFGPIVLVGIDWDPRDAYWGNRSVAAKKAFLVGYLTQGFRQRGILPSYFPPMIVRKIFGLPATAPKQELHQRFLDKFPGQAEAFEASDLHQRDAILLAYIAGSVFDVNVSSATS